MFAAGADIVQIDEPYMQARPNDAREYGLKALNHARDVKFLRANTDHPIKITVPGPFTMSHLYSMPPLDLSGDTRDRNA